MRYFPISKALACLGLAACAVQTCAAAAVGQVSDGQIQAASSTTSASAMSMPTVDLGYARYKPTTFNQTGQYYNFSNIRFAAPPTGQLRWRAPQPPLQEPANQVNDGSLGYTCVQQPAPWFETANTALGDLAAYIAPGTSGQNESEDCLFLDVTVPTAIYNNALSHNASSDTSSAKSNRKLAPVLVNIHGGGFFIGDKFVLYYPNGLLERGNNSFIYVSMNYRLAALGFLAGVDGYNTTANSTSPNAGFLDQRMALKWVRQYIHLFGGDPDDVTITGESAGGTSVQLHGIAYGGAKEANLFVRGIAQSPATLTPDPIILAECANEFLSALNVTSVEAARNVSTAAIKSAANSAQLLLPFDTAAFAPMLDADILLDTTARAYLNGRYIKNISMIAANNNNEARFLGNQSVNSSAGFAYFPYSAFPSANESVKQYIVNDLYPAAGPSNYTQLNVPYMTSQERNNLAVKEYLIECNTIGIASAYGNKSHNYVFSLFPAIHANDLAYTYYPSGATPNFDLQIALSMQQYLTNFVRTGNPNTPDNGTFSIDNGTEVSIPYWPEFTKSGNALNLTASGVQQIISPAVNERCYWWNQGLWYPNVATTYSTTS